METLNEGLMEILQFIAGIASFVVMLLLIYVGVKLLHKIVDEL